ncbi:MAG TPA: hypothetical protein VI094_14120 [Propionibacteriaceae bacterium]
MSALPVAFPEISDPEISATQAHRSVRADARSRGITGARTAAGNWQLTDRGIAVVMLIAAVILTAALAVTGITVVRVTSADYDAGVPEFQQTHR